jgi:hypothetical protein
MALPGDTEVLHVIISSEVANMKNVFSLRKRSFLSPVSTGYTSHIFAEVESSNEGEYR